MRAGRDILGDYGPNANKPQRARATTGGVKMGDKRDVMNYKPPCGPTNIMDPQGPGLHGHNCGNANRPMGSDGAMGQPGLGGDARRKGGTQR